jgi:hypothetical protein
MARLEAEALAERRTDPAIDEHARLSVDPCDDATLLAAAPMAHGGIGGACARRRAPVAWSLPPIRYAREA